MHVTALMEKYKPISYGRKEASTMYKEVMIMSPLHSIPDILVTGHSTVHADIKWCQYHLQTATLTLNCFGIGSCVSEVP